MKPLLAHKMTEFVTTGGKIDCASRFEDMVELLRKIEVWWIKNVDLATDPDWVGQEVDENAIMPGSLLTLQLMTKIALGSEEESKFYFEEFMKRNPDL